MVRTGMLTTMVALALLGCGNGDDGPGDAGTGQAAAPESIGDDGGGDCGPGSLPGCSMPVQICEGGQCSCQCADPVTTGASATAGDSSGGTAGDSTGGAMCPDEAIGSDAPACDTPGVACDTIGGCCRCDVFEGCGDASVWMCVEIVPDPACPLDVPAIGDPCDAEGTSCRLCDADGPVVRVCAGGMWTEGAFSCL